MQGEHTAANGGTNGDCPLDSEVGAALERLKQRMPFAQAPRLAEFLTYVIEETLAGRGDRIIGYNIGVDVYGRPETFDPAVETIVRVEARRLRDRLADYYREEGADDPIEITVPKGSYVPEFRYRSGARVIRATVTSGKQAQVDHGPSIAVLPFDSYGNDPDGRSFTDGLTEETIANLARFKELSVYSRTTTAKLALQGASVRDLNEELGVEFVLEGSVRKSSDVVRVTAQLIDAATDVHVLSEKFERPCTPDGVFEIQDEMALLVASRIADRHGPLGRYVARAKRSGKSQQWETYIWITRFYDYYATHDPKLHFKVREGLTKALEHDQDSSDGWAALSIVLLDEHRVHINERTSYPALEHAISYAQRAVSCDPESAFAYHALALAYFHYGEFIDFRVAANRALQLNPGLADMLADLAVCFTTVGDEEEALKLSDRAIALSPVHPGWYHMPRVVHHILGGDVGAALVELKQVPIPGYFWYHAFLAGLLAELGKDDEAAVEVDQLKTVYPDFAANARDELSIWHVHETMAETLIRGWRKAGLEIG